jgi:hypothetical protein
MRLARWVAGVQALLYIATGLWPVLHMKSFLAVTGPKTDLWLVESFGLLVAAFGAALGHGAIFRRLNRELELAAFAVASTLAFIDVYYVYRGVISKTYLLDGGAELALAIAWLLLLLPSRAGASSGHLSAKERLTA